MQDRSAIKFVEGGIIVLVRTSEIVTGTLLVSARPADSLSSCLSGIHDKYFEHQIPRLSRSPGVLMHLKIENQNR